MPLISVLNTTANLSGKTIAVTENAQTITGAWTFDRDPSAPFVVPAGSAVVANLDADKVDGYEAAALGVLAENETVTGAWTFTGATTVGDLRGTAETITATGTVNDQALGATTTILRCNNASLLTITGFTGGTAGRVLIVYSVGAGNVEFDHQAGSTAANQLLNSVTVGNTPLLAGKGYAVYVYDGTASRWRLITHAQGGWITPTFAAGDYTASAGNWTVDSGDVTTFKYVVTGNTLHVQYNIVNTDVSATPAGLIRAIPGGYTSVSAGGSTIVHIDNGGTRTIGAVTWTAGGASITFEKASAAGTWGTTAADNTSVFGTATFDIT